LSTASSFVLPVVLAATGLVLGLFRLTEEFGISNSVPPGSVMEPAKEIATLVSNGSTNSIETVANTVPAGMAVLEVPNAPNSNSPGETTFHSMLPKNADEMVKSSLAP
jgi:hypothetical protein